MSATAATAEKPNIVLIVGDDMGFSDIGCYGGEIDTPNLDRLAGNGLRFTQFYNGARCCPTRASLLTGLYAHQAGVGHMMTDRGLVGYRGDLNRNCVTIAEALRPAGYRAYAVGKWHVTKKVKPESEVDRRNWPLQRGFDRFYGTIHGAGSFFDPNSLTRGNKLISPDADPEYRPAQFYYTDAISDNAVRTIDDHAAGGAESPFFMYVAYTAAHWPMQALAKDIAKYKGKYDHGYQAVRRARFKRVKKLGLISPAWELTPLAGDWSAVTNKAWEARCMEVYAAMVDNMDQGIGRIVAALERHGQLDNTLIFFLQDNGACAETLGRQAKGDYTARPDQPPFPPMAPGALQYDMIPKQTRDGYPVVRGSGIMPGPGDTYIAYGRGWANVSNTPFREYKHWVHEGGIATPLVVHWPEGFSARGELRAQPGHLIDIMATCVDVAGAGYPERHAGQTIAPLEGTSLRPVFENRPLDRDLLYWEHEGNRAVREGKLKLVAKGPAGPWELYDLETDRTEMRDLARVNPAMVTVLAAKWEIWAKTANVIPWIWKPAYGEDPGNVGSTESRFELAPGTDLPRDRSPRVVGRGLLLGVEIDRMGDNGVLVAQGGSSHGYALYLEGRRLCFAVRHDSRLTTVSSERSLSPAPSVVVAQLGRSGNITLVADRRPLITATSPGPLKRHPLGGLQVGRDDGGAVGEYRSPFPFEGKIRRVIVELD